MSTFGFIATLKLNSVVIIDCLSEHDSNTGLHLYNGLRDLNLSAAEFHVIRVVVGSIKELVDLLERVEQHCRSSNMRPILHFEAHGSRRGFSILGGDTPQWVEWQELTPLLRSVNVATGYNLGVFFAACEGLYALSHITIKQAAPFQYLVGPQVEVSAALIEDTALRFYRELLATGDITGSFDEVFKGYPFQLFLAEKMLAITYGRVLKKQSIGKARQKRVDELVNMAIAQGAAHENLQEIRVKARLFSRPDAERFRMVQERFLPGGIGFTFEQLVTFLRAGPDGNQVLPYTTTTTTADEYEPLPNQL